MSSVTVTGTIPATRKSGAALALTDIKSIDFQRNGNAVPAMSITTFAAGATTFTATDTSPASGSDTYTATVTANDPQTTTSTSGLSNAATVTVALADPPSAIADLAATFAP